MEKPPFQFGLKTMFAVTTAASLLFAGLPLLLAVCRWVPSWLLETAGVFCFLAAEAAIVVLWFRLCVWLIDVRQPPDA